MRTDLALFPFIDHLKYAKMEEEGLGDFTEVNVNWDTVEPRLTDTPEQRTPTV